MLKVWISYALPYCRCLDFLNGGDFGILSIWCTGRNLSVKKVLIVLLRDIERCWGRNRLRIEIL